MHVESHTKGLSSATLRVTSYARNYGQPVPVSRKLAIVQPVIVVE